jgi:predicted metal-binding membrane protein
MDSATNLEAFLKRDRWFVLAGLAGATALAWAYLVVMAADMDAMAMGAVAMPAVETWSALDFWLMFVMWAVMMVGMMLPGAAPMILLYAAVSRRQRGRGHVFAPTGVFAAGYLVAWTVFSLAATALQWTLEQMALLSPMMASTSPYLGGGLLVAAGIYQWTPLKHACLQNCRVHPPSSCRGRGETGRAAPLQWASTTASIASAVAGC